MPEEWTNTLLRYVEGPDISVFRGLPKVDRTIESYDIRTGISPCLIIEVVSPGDSRVRQVDEVTKVGLREEIERLRERLQPE